MKLTYLFFLLFSLPLLVQAEQIIPLGKDLAEIKLSSDLRYLDADKTYQVLVEQWKNPKDAAEGALGMLVPAGLKDQELVWGIIISFDETGYVSDKDAKEINYDELLEEMKQQVQEGNKWLRDNGFAERELVGWAKKPFYDKDNKKLHWAKELRFSDSPLSTLNYQFRILGRQGVLVLNAVSGMSRLAEIEKISEPLLKSIEFKKGHRYEDFDSSLDKIAVGGIAALVTGKLAVKLGLFAKLLKLLIAFKKIILIAVFAGGAFVASLFKKQKSE